MRLVNWRTLVASAASIALAACGDDVTVVQPIPTLTLNPASVTCQAGTSTAVGVTVGGATGTPTVTFAGSGAGFTVTGSGTGATVACTTAGSGVINVTVTANGQTVTGSIPVTVTAAPIPVSAVTVTPQTATIAVNGTVQLTPTVITTSTGTATTVTYTSVNPTIATVDANGVVRGVAPGVATIRVSPTAAPNLVAVSTVTVVAASAFVQSLTVNPSNVTLQTGGTQTVASTVTLASGAPAGTSTGVNYTSSDTSVATVSSTGVITARRNGTAVITVSSVAAPGITQAISVTVRDPAPVRLTIQGVRVIGAAGTLVPADLTNVGGNLFVTLNLDPGDFRPDSVRIRLGAQTVNCQRFSAELAEAYRLALTTGSADVQQIECQVNTSQFNAIVNSQGQLVARDASRPLGAADVLNGQQPLTAEVFFRPQGAAAGTQTQTATIPLQLTVNNASGFYVQVSNTPSASQAAVNAAGQATGPQGVLWRAGTIDVTVLPVNFVNVVNPGTQTFTISLQDAVNGVFAQRTATQTAGNAATYSVSFPGTSANTFDFAPALTARVLDGYTSPNAGVAPAFNPQGAYTGGGTLVVVGTAAGTGNTVILNAAGQPAGLGGGFGNSVAQPIFIDNQNPQPAVNFGLNGGVLGPPNANFASTGAAFVGFINNAFTFQNSLTPQFLTGANNAASALTANNPDFGGVDRVTIQFFAGTSTSATTLTGGTAITNGGNLSPSATNTANNLAVAMTDALGNRRNQRVGSGAGGANLAIDATGSVVSGNLFLSFGVDVSPPTIAQTAGQTANYVTSSAAAQTFQFAGSDETGFGTNPILITISRTARITSTTVPQGNQADVASNSSTTTSAPATYCATAIDAAGNVTFADAPGGTCNPIATPGSVTIPGGLNGQYSITAMARDQAGNQSGTITRIVVIDTKAPIIGGIGLPQTITGNSPVTFTTSATDNLELGSTRGEIDFAATLALQYPEISLGSAFDNVFTASNTALPITINQFIRSITLAPGAAVQQTRQVATNFRAVVLDLANNLAFTNLAIPAGNLGNLSATSPFNNATTTPVNQINLFGISATENRAGGATGGNVTFSAGATAGQATSVTINVSQTGGLNTFVSPLQRIELYVQVPGLAGAPPTYRFIGTAPAGLVTDNANNNGARVITSSFTLSATTTPFIVAPAAGTNSYVIRAVGVNSTGDALVSDPILVNVLP